LDEQRDQCLIYLTTSRCQLAEALESMPLASAVNAGFEPINIQAELREKRGAGKMWVEVDVPVSIAAERRKYPVCIY
jgi:hypothetical protein